MTGILGSGFGLYGYLPALTTYRDGGIALEERYRERFLKRKELQFFYTDITWMASRNKVLQYVDAVAICLSPAQQGVAIEESLEQNGIRYLLLEKPLAVTPLASESLLDRLVNSGKHFRIGYTFQYTDWALRIERAKNVSRININWRFMAHHYRNRLQNWKRLHNEGGAAIRFYGIHCIALAAQLSYSEVNHSRSVGFSANDLFCWNTSFTGEGLPPMEVHIDSMCDESGFDVTFHHRDGTNERINLADPFSKEGGFDFTTIDPRVGLLIKVAESLFEDEDHALYYRLYRNTIQLWQQVEDINQNEIAQPDN